METSVPNGHTVHVYLASHRLKGIMEMVYPTDMLYIASRENAHGVFGMCTARYSTILACTAMYTGLIHLSDTVVLCYVRHLAFGYTCTCYSEKNVLIVN